jgi:hypothetical protein
MGKKIKLIKISDTTYQKLSSLGQFHDTFDKIIVKLLENQQGWETQIKK